MNGGEVLVEALRRQGVDTLFVVPGEHLDPLFEALSDHSAGMRIVHTRHEQGAAFMAYGYARSRGGIGVFAVPPGPGFLNTTSALATGYAGNARMLCLTGQVPLNAIGRGQGVLHEIPDQLGILRSLTKWADRMCHPTHGPRLVAEAFGHLRRGRPRPVGIEVPSDVMAEAAEVDFDRTEMATCSAPLDHEAIGRAAALLGAARRPLIMVGGGAVGAGEDLLSIAELLQVPVVSNCSGRGIVSDRHYLSLTWPAGHSLWRNADVVLAVGTRLFQPLTQWGVDETLKIIRIDIDPSEIGRVRRPAIGIVADAKVALAALRDALLATKASGQTRKEELVALKSDFAAKFASLRPQYDYLMAIRDELPDDGYFVDELTQIGYVARFAFPVYRECTYIPATYQGTLGYGFAAALGVKVAHPDKPVISVCGDGGFMYNAQELATAVQHEIAVVVIVFNDNAYGNIRRTQLKHGYRLATDLHNPKFHELAKSFGAVGALVSNPQELRREIRTALASGRPTVIEVPVGEMPDPWGFIRLPAVRRGAA